MNIIIGNLFGFISSIFLGLSVYKKSKKSMLLYQSIDATFAFCSCIILGGLNGALNNFIGILRNIFLIKTKCNNFIKLSLISLSITIGLYNFYNLNHVWYELLPIIASLIYSITLFYIKNYDICKFSLIINRIFWIIYLFIIKSYASCIVSVILAINTFNSLIKSRRKLADNGLTKFQRKG